MNIPLRILIPCGCLLTITGCNKPTSEPSQSTRSAGGPVYDKAYIGDRQAELKLLEAKLKETEATVVNSGLTQERVNEISVLDWRIKTIKGRIEYAEQHLGEARAQSEGE